MIVLLLLLLLLIQSNIKGGDAVPTEGFGLDFAKYLLRRAEPNTDGLEVPLTELARRQMSLDGLPPPITNG